MEEKEKGVEAVNICIDKVQQETEWNFVYRKVVNGRFGTWFAKALLHEEPIYIIGRWYTVIYLNEQQFEELKMAMRDLMPELNRDMLN